MTKIAINADTWIRSGDPVHGASETLTCGAWTLAGVDQPARVLLSADLSALTEAQGLASLALNVTDAAEEEAAFSIVRVTSSWSEAFATWTFREILTLWSTPGGDLDPTVADSAICPTTVGYRHFDVINTVNDAIANRAGLWSVCLAFDVESAPPVIESDPEWTFNSSEFPPLNPVLFVFSEAEVDRFSIGTPRVSRAPEAIAKVARSPVSIPAVARSPIATPRVSRAPVQLCSVARDPDRGVRV